MQWVLGVGWCCFSLPLPYSIGQGEISALRLREWLAYDTPNTEQMRSTTVHCHIHSQPKGGDYHMPCLAMWRLHSRITWTIRDGKGWDSIKRMGAFWCQERIWLACWNNFAGWQGIETHYSAINRNYAFNIPLIRIVVQGDLINGGRIGKGACGQTIWRPLDFTR